MKKNKTIKKKDLKNAHFWMSVLLVGVIFSATFSLFIVDIFKEQKATVSILVIAKSEQASSQIENITNNIADFPKMLSFYERLIKINPQVKDNFIGKSQDERKRLWNEIIDVSIDKSEKGSIIYLSAHSKSSADAETLVKIINTNLFQILGNYYDTDNDISVSIVDGPLVSVVSRKLTTIIVVSLIFGMASSLLLNIILGAFEKNIKTKKIKSAIFPKIKLERNLEPSDIRTDDGYKYDVPYDFEKLDNQEVNIMYNYENDIENPDKEFSYPNFPEMPNTPFKKASAPDNLPIDNNSTASSDLEKESTLKEEIEFVEVKKEEPTTEELKHRLNKLLRGDM